MAKQYKKIYRYDLYNVNGTRLAITPVPAVVDGMQLLGQLSKMDLTNVYKIEFVVNRMTFDLSAPLNSLTIYDRTMSAMAGMPLARVNVIEKKFACYVTDQLRTTDALINELSQKKSNLDGIRATDRKYSILDSIQTYQTAAHLSQIVPESKTEISLHGLSYGDIVVDHKMNQIYPKHTGDVPRLLVKFLAGNIR